MAQANALHEVPLEFQDGVSAARLVPYSRSWYIAKIILRAVSLLLCIVIFILAVVSVDTYRGYDLSWASCVPPALAAALYDIASFVVVCVRRAKKRGIHPGIDVAADLIIWLTCGIGATWVPAGGVTVNAAGYMSGADIAMMIFLYVLLVFHFVLFCRDCHETRQRNKSRPFEKFVYIPGGGKPFPVLVPAAHGHAAPQPQPVAVVDPEPAVPETDAYGPPPEPEDIDLSYSQGSIQKEIIPEDFYPHNRR